MRTVRRTAAALALVLAAGCSATPADGPEAAPPDETSDERSDQAASGPASAAETTNGPATGADQPAPASDLLAFTGRQLDGGTFDGAAVTGDVVVWFWAPW